MKIQIGVILIVWMFITMILVLSIIGWVVILPKINGTVYFKTVAETRSTWMSIGYDLKDKLTT